MVNNSIETHYRKSPQIIEHKKTTTYISEISCHGLRQAQKCGETSNSQRITRDVYFLKEQLCSLFVIINI